MHKKHGIVALALAMLIALLVGFMPANAATGPSVTPAEYTGEDVPGESDIAEDAPPTADPVTCVGDACTGGVLTHYSPDTGHDGSIIVFCDYGDVWENRKHVPEGTNSKAVCGTDTDQIYARTTEEIWCRVYWEDAGPATGWHWYKAAAAGTRVKIIDFWKRSCTVRLK